VLSLCYNTGGRSCDQRQTALAFVCHASDCREETWVGQQTFGAIALIPNKEAPCVPKNSAFHEKTRPGGCAED